MSAIRFNFNAAKAMSAIHWMVRNCSGIDLHTLLKACYFADKSHLNKHYRPVFGATYRAMRFGPVPLEIYEMAKSEAIWLPEAGRSTYPWRLDGYRLFDASNDEVDMAVLSEDDMEDLEAGFNQSRKLDFNARTAATHGNDWQAAELGLMRYEDMIEDSPERTQIINYLRSNARFMRI